MLTLPPEKRVAEYLRVTKEWLATGNELRLGDKARIEASFKQKDIKNSTHNKLMSATKQATHPESDTNSSQPYSADPPKIVILLFLATIIILIAGGGYFALPRLWQLVTEQLDMLSRLALWSVVIACFAWTVKSALTASSRDAQGQPLAGIALILISAFMMAFIKLPSPVGWGLIVVAISVLIRVYVPFYLFVGVAVAAIAMN